VCVHVCVYVCVCMFVCVSVCCLLCNGAMCQECAMGWLRLVGSLKLYVSFATDPYKRDDIMLCQVCALAMGWLRLVESIKL